LRFEAEPARSPEGCLRVGELPSQAANLAAEVGGPRGGGLVGRSLGASVGALRLDERVLPRTPQAQDFGSMDRAAARESEQVGLVFAPVGQRVRPLACPPHVVDVLAGEDHAAVDDSRHDRVDAFGGHGHHRLV
jgi:hypothetical protein